MTTKKNNRNIIIGIGAIIIVAFLVIFYIALSPGKTAYESEEEMKNALQGTYYFKKENGYQKNIIISGDEVTYSSNVDNEGISTSITEWDYKKGKIHTFEDITVTDGGNLKVDGDLYIKIY